MAETLAEHAGHMRRYLQQHPLPCVRDERRKHFSGVRYLHIIICLQIRIQGAVTRPEDCGAALRAFKAAFEVRGLGAAWERVIAIVVQPGVEFADESVVEYERGAARELCGFPDCFEVVVGSLHNGIPEDKTAVLREALRLMGLGPGEAVMIGDRAWDVLAARRLGLDCIGVELCGYAGPSELEDAGAAVARDIAGLEALLMREVS